MSHCNCTGVLPVENYMVLCCMDMSQFIWSFLFWLFISFAVITVVTVISFIHVCLRIFPRCVSRGGLAESKVKWICNFGKYFEIPLPWRVGILHCHLWCGGGQVLFCSAAKKISSNFGKPNSFWNSRVWSLCFEKYLERLISHACNLSPTETMQCE